MKRFFALFMVAVFVLASIPVYAVTNLSAKDKYLKLEKSSIEKLENNLSNSKLEKYFDFCMDLFDKSYKANSTVEVVIPGIETRKYLVEENFDYNNNYIREEIKAYVENEQVATIDTILDNEKLSVKVPELFNKYITADLGDIHSLVKKFDPEADLSSMPNKIVNPFKLSKEIEPTLLEETLLKASGLKYAKLLEENFLKEEFFVEGEKALTQINNQNLNLNEVKYVINQKDFKNATMNILRAFRNDTVLINLLYDKSEKVYNIYKDAGYAGYEEEFPKKEELMVMFDSIVEEFNNSEVDENSFLELSLYYDNNNNILKRELNIAEYNEKENICTLFTFEADGYYAFVTEESKLEDFVTKNLNSENHKFVLTYENLDYNYELDTFETVIEEKSMDMKITKLSENAYKVDFIIDGMELVNMECKLNNLTAKNLNMAVNLNFNVLGKTCSLNTLTNIDTNVSVAKPDVKNNEVNLNTTPNDELMRLAEENMYNALEQLEGKFGTAFYYQEIKGLLEMISPTVEPSSLEVY